MRAHTENRISIPSLPTLVITLCIVLLLILFLASCSSEPTVKSLAQPATTSRPVQEAALTPCLETYAGRYTAEAPFPTHPKAVRRLVLTLNRDWTSSLKTQYAGSAHPPTEESGTWRCDGARAHVLLSGGNKGPERNELTFEMQQGTLVATKLDKDLYGKNGLQMKKE